jgi:hypothetical protein
MPTAFTGPDRIEIDSTYHATLFRLEYDQDRRGSPVRWKVEWQDYEEERNREATFRSKAVALPFFEQKRNESRS